MAACSPLLTERRRVQADVSKQLTRLPPPPEEPIRPHGKRMVIKKGCDCEWCEAVSWDIVGELRETCEKLQQSLMMREVDRCAPPSRALRSPASGA